VLWVWSTRAGGALIFHKHWMTGLVLMDLSLCCCMSSLGTFID
jgi:hypothetical protein